MVSIVSDGTCDPSWCGKVVVQARRCKHTAGVSAVHDLHGTVLDEGAAIEVLVTTSVYGTGSFEPAWEQAIGVPAWFNFESVGTFR